MNGFRVTIDGKAVDCETRSFDYVRFEREFGIPFSSVAFEASRGEMRLEHLFWLAFCAWQRTTGDTEMTFDEWGDLLDEAPVSLGDGEEADDAPLAPTP